MRRTPFQVTRNGEPILSYPLKGGIDTGIRYSSYFEGWQACIAAGLDIERWQLGGYERGLMASTVAWYRLSKAVEQHSEAAVAAKAKAK